mgnify:FL=1
MTKCLFFLQILLLSLLLNGFITSTSFARVNNLALTSLSSKNGLAQGSINAIIEDRLGFIWLATDRGVNIYDGNAFRELLGPNEVFKETNIQGLIEDNEGLIWIDVGTDILYSYNPKTDVYQLISTNKFEKKADTTRDVLIGDEGNIWILNSKSLGLYNKNTSEFQTFLNFEPQMSNSESMQQMSHHDGVLYLSSNVGVFAVSPKTMQWRKLPTISHYNSNETTFNPKKTAEILTLHAGSNNLLYLGTADGLFSINISNIMGFITEKKLLNEYQLLITKTVANDLFVDDKHLYLATEKGAFSIDLVDNSIEFLFNFNDHYGDIAVHNIQSITKARDGIFWLGSKANGVYLWNPKRGLFKNYRYKSEDPTSLSSNEVWSVLSSPTDKETLWVGTSNGLNKVDITEDKVSQYIVKNNSDASTSENNIKRIQALNEQQLLISTFLGMRLFDILQHQFIALPFSQKINELLALEQNDIYMDGDYLWVANKKGFFRINFKTEVIEILEEINKQFPGGFGLRFLKALPNSNNVLLTSNNSLWSYNDKTQELKLVYQQPNKPPGQSNIDIDSWAIDGQNILWLGFYSKGLVGLTLDTFETKYLYNQSNSTIDNHIYGLMTDIDGDVWFSTHNGLYMLDNVSHHFSHYSTDDGLGANEFNNRAYSKISHDLFAYGSMKGVSIFSPSQLKKAYSGINLNVQITNIDVLSRPLKTPLVIGDNTSVDLKYDDVGIQIDFSTFSFISEDKIEYEFSLAGKSNLIYPPSKNSYIIFPSLPSGSTSFTIRAKSPQTGKYLVPVTLHFNVSYAPWRSPQAYTLYIIIVALILVMWYRYRQVQRQLLFQAHQQVKNREERLQLALNASNSEVWDWQSTNNLISSKRIFAELGHKNNGLFYSLDKHIKLIHPNDRHNFLALWQSFIANANLEDNFSCTYRLKTVKGNWLWYKDLGKIVAVDSFGKPNRVIGAYTNITELRANEERAQYYGDAFKQTKDWVLIIDENLSHVTANHSMRKVFGWGDEVFKFKFSMLGVKEEKKLFYKTLLLSLEEGKNWSGEELITSKNEEFHLMINIGAAKNSETNNKHYICVFTNISAQKHAENELRLLANYDHLTGLPNRPFLLDRIKHAIDFSKRKNTPIALFFIDLDRFKQVNDSLGHQYGDLLLKEISQRLTSSLRVDDTVARIGGDEFVILLESFTDSRYLGDIAQKIIDKLAEPIKLKNNIVSVSASIGIALYPDDAVTSDQLLKNADLAMYYAKELGRNNFQFFTGEMNVKAKNRLSQVSTIKQAIINNEFVNFYQPIVNPYTGQTAGFELLMRWQSPEGIIAPDNFIPLAEELGLIIKMTEAALDRGLTDLKQWCDVRDDLYISVNITSQHFAKDSLLPYIEKLLSDHKLTAKSLRIELTESDFMFEPEKTIQSMHALSKLGVKLALDDFGMGFSSLVYLKRLPLDVIKIDKSFVSGIGINQADEAIVETTLTLAKRLNLQSVAEGVETKEQRDYLIHNNCHYIQGYLYSRPLPANEIMTILMTDNAV